jgi:hypothetical protein
MEWVGHQDLWNFRKGSFLHHTHQRSKSNGMQGAQGIMDQIDDLVLIHAALQDR